MKKVESVALRRRPGSGLGSWIPVAAATLLGTSATTPAALAATGGASSVRQRALSVASAPKLVVETAPSAPVATTTPRPPRPKLRPEPGERVLTLREAPAEAFVLSKDAQSRPVDLSKGAVTLEKDQLLLNKTVEEPRVVAEALTRPGATAPPLALPYEMHFLDPAGEKRSCELVAEVGSGFHVASSGRLFVAELYVALKDRSDWSKSYELPQPVQVLVTAPVDELAPKLLSLQKTNTWQAIKLGEDSPENTVRVKLRPVVDPAGLELAVPVTRPRVSLSLNPSEIQGFGLDVAKVVVAVNGSTNTAGRAVTLTASQGRLSATRLVLDAEGTAETTVRSEGSGHVFVTAQGVGAEAARAEGHFRWPVTFLLFAVLGALGGTLVSFLRLRSTAPQSVRQSAQEIAGGVLLGVLTAVAYAAGVNALGIALPTFGGEALVFTAAALGAAGLGNKLTTAAKSGDAATATQGR